MGSLVPATAVRIGEPGALELVQVELREPGPHEVLVRVHAAGLNRADILQRRGMYPAPVGVPPDLVGLEYAGVVEAVGAGEVSFTMGDSVMGIVGGGAMATHVVVHEREAMRVPHGLSFVEAAAVPEVFLTAYDALFMQASLTVGQVVLVHAVGSGVGTAVLQLARAAGATVIGTSRTEEKIRRCIEELGLDHGIVVRDGKFADELKEISGGRLAEVLVDTVGAAYLAENIRAIARCGHIVMVGLLGGAKGEIPLAPMLAKRIRISATVLRSGSLEEKALLSQAFSRDVIPLFESGRLRPTVGAVLPMAEIAEAHRRMEANATFGKIVLAWPEA